MVAQLILRLEQPPYDSGSQTKGIPTWPIGRTDRRIGMRLNPKQLRRQMLQ
jgi:hypothetical protein